MKKIILITAALIFLYGMAFGLCLATGQINKEMSEYAGGVPSIFILIAIIAIIRYRKQLKNKPQNNYKANPSNSIHNSALLINKNNDDKPILNKEIIQEQRDTHYTKYRVDDNGVIVKRDGSTIEDNEINELVKIGYDLSIQKEKDNPNPKYHRTLREEELSDNFYTRYQGILEKYESELYDAVIVTKQIKSSWINNASLQEIQEKINLCDNAIELFEKFKIFCNKKGKGGMIYFEDMWEHCNNSKNPCFSYIDDTIAMKDKLKKEYVNRSF